jgi:iron complex transport system substrate-binding protein
MQQSHRLAAIDEYSNVVAGLDKTAVIGKGSAISREQVLALRIDLAFVWWFQDDAAAMLEGLGVSVVRIRSGRAREVPAMIRLVGDCLGCRLEAGTLALPVEQFLEQAASRPAQAGARPVVYLELYSPFKTVGGDSYLSDLIELAGGRNVAAGAKGSVLLSAERLIQDQPDVVLFVQGFGDAGAIASRPGFADLKAIRAGQVHSVDRRWTIAGPGLPQAVAYLRSVLSPGDSQERR